MKPSVCLITIGLALFMACNSPSKPQREKIEALLGDFVFVEGGAFVMGDSINDPNGHISHVPHEVRMDGFHMQSKETTQDVYSLVMGENPSADQSWKDLPVSEVSWNDCMIFLEKLNSLTGGNYRLPTEAEWEYAARGGALGSNQLFSGSNDPDSVAWHRGNSKGRIQPVGLLKPNSLGIYDMSGNAWEWCSDFYGDYRTDSSQRHNPVGIDYGVMKVFRGGSFGDSARYCKTSSRFYTDPLLRYPSIGMRLVKDKAPSGQNR